MQHLCNTLDPVVEEEYQDFIFDSDEEAFVPPKLVKREDMLDAGFNVAPDYNDSHAKAKQLLDELEKKEKELLILDEKSQNQRFSQLSQANIKLDELHK